MYLLELRNVLALRAAFHMNGYLRRKFFQLVPTDGIALTNGPAHKQAVYVAILFLQGFIALQLCQHCQSIRSSDEGIPRL